MQLEDESGALAINFRNRIKIIPHPPKIPKDQDKMVMNYKFEEVVGYGKNNSRSKLILYTFRCLGKSKKGLGC